MSAPVPHDGIVVRNARLAVKNELEKKRLLNQPIARFDPKSGKVYMEHADGTKTLVGEAIKKVDMENKPIKKPEIVVFAGPNGSGKSTITDLLRPPMLPYVNADEIQRVLDCDNMEAAKIAEKRREDYLDKHKGFCFETVLSTDRNLKLLKRAKDAGFFVRCYYVLTADPQINVARVASRVSAGGHGVPTEKIISRYDKALALVHELVPLCDVCHIYDNSLDAPYRIFKKRKEEYWYCPERYLWKKDDITALTGVPNAQRASLNNHRT